MVGFLARIIAIALDSLANLVQLGLLRSVGISVTLVEDSVNQTDLAAFGRVFVSTYYLYIHVQMYLDIVNEICKT